MFYLKKYIIIRNYVTRYDFPKWRRQARSSKKGDNVGDVKKVRIHLTSPASPQSTKITDTEPAEVIFKIIFGY